MSTKATIEIDLNLANADKNLKELNKETTKVLNTLEGMRDESARLTKQLEKTEIGTKAYKDLSKELIKVNTQLKNQDLALESLDREQLASELKSVAGGLTDMATGLTLIGVSDSGIEEMMQTFTKIEGITRAVTGGIEAYSSGVKVLNAMAAKGATTQSVYASLMGKTDGALKGAKKSNDKLNLSLLKSPIFILVAAIGAVVAALVYFSESEETAEEKSEKLNKSLDKQVRILGRQSRALIQDAKWKLELAIAEGKSIEEIHQLKLEVIDAEEIARKEEMDLTIKHMAKLKDKAIEDKIWGSGEKAKEYYEKRAALQSHLEDLKNDRNKWHAETVIENKGHKKRLEDDTAKIREAARKRAEALRRKNRDEIIKGENEEQARARKLAADKEAREIELGAALTAAKEAERRSTMTEEEKAIEDIEKSYTRRFDLAEEMGYGLVELEEQMQKEIADIQKKYEEEVEVKQEEKIDKEKEKNQALIKATVDGLRTLEDANANIFATMIENSNNVLLALEDDTLNRLGKIQAFAQAAAQISSQVIGEMTKKTNEERDEGLEESKENYDEDTTNLKDQLENRLISQAEYDAELYKLDQAKETKDLALRRKAFEQNKKMQMANATIQTAQAVLAAWGSGAVVPVVGPITTGPAFAAIAAAIGAIQIGMIASTQFRAAKGGIVPRNGQSQNEDSVSALLAPGEAVINSNSSAAFAPLLSSINEAGGGNPLISNINGINNSPIMKVYGDGEKSLIQAYVTEQQISSTQNRIKNIKQRSKLF